MPHEKAFSVYLKPLCYGSLAVLGWLACSTQAHADNTTYTTSHRADAPAPAGLTAQAVGVQSFYYDTNPQLLTTGAQNLWGSISSPELIIQDRTDLTTLDFDTVFTSNNFNRTAFSSNDIHSKLAFNKQIQRWTVGMQGHVDYDTTLTSEMSGYNLGLISSARHFGGMAAPQIAYNFLPTDRIDIIGSYTTSSYDNRAFTNYNIVSVKPTYTHDFNQTNAGYLSVQADRYRTTNGISNVVDTVGPLMGWRTSLTQRIKAGLEVGFQETRQKTATAPSSSWSPEYAFSGNVAFKGVEDQITAKISRSQYPFGNGTEAFLTEFSLNGAHALNEVLSIGSGGSYRFTDYQATTRGSVKTLTTGTVNLTYHVTEHLDFISSYEYQYQTLIDVSKGAQENKALFSIAYRPRAWTL